MTAMMSMEIVRGETSSVVNELSPTEVERADAKTEGETSGWIGGFIFLSSLIYYIPYIIWKENQEL